LTPRYPRHWVNPLRTPADSFVCPTNRVYWKRKEGDPLTVWKSHGLRGDALESLLLKTNDYYRTKQLARIDKIHVPVKVVELSEKGLITKAYFEKKSTIDFQGVIQGVGVAFEAKETHQKSLPLYNIHEHQVDFMRDFDAQGGLTFIIVHFKFNDTYFLIPFEVVSHYYRVKTRKSIPFSAMNPAYKIEVSPIGLLNYLPALNAYVRDKLILAEFKNKNKL
jgi:recombination protein U